MPLAIMEAPPEVTLEDLSGIWIMNKTLSDDMDGAFALQGLSWFTRKAISLTTITVTIKQYLDPLTQTVNLDIMQRSSTGLPGVNEHRCLDWTFREAHSHLFGHVKGRSRRCALDEIEDEELRKGFEEGTEEVIETNTVGLDSGSDAKMVWGFARIGGKRFHVRHGLVKKDEEIRRAKVVYNWIGREERVEEGDVTATVD